MKCLYPIDIILFVLGAVLFPAPVHAQSTGYPDLDLYYSQLDKNRYGTDTARIWYLMRTIPHDSFIRDYMERGIEVTRDTVSLFTFFAPGSISASKEERLQLLDGMDAAARRHKSKRLELAADYFRVWMMEGFRPEPFEARMDGLEQIVAQSRRAGDRFIEMCATAEMWLLNSISNRYARSFAYAKRYEDVLDKMDDDTPGKGGRYIALGRSYYDSGDYGRALPLLYKGLRKGRSYQGQNLTAWNYLAVYHQKNNHLDSAACYNRTILASEEGLREKSVHLGIAVSNLGRIALARGDHDAAIAMLEAGLECMKQHNDLSFVVGLYTSLGEAWLAKGDLATAKSYIDRVYDERHKFADEAWQNRAVRLFRLESGYYTRLGQHELAGIYLDSVLTASRNYQQYVGRHNILLGEQQLQEAEIELKLHQVTWQRSLIAFSIAIIILISAALLVIIRLYRRRNAACKILAQQAQEWAMQENRKTNGSAKGHPTEEDLRIMALADREMTENHAYRQAGLTVKSMADLLGVHRNTLARAVSRTTDGNFSLYINKFRVKEAIRIISQTNRKELYIGELSERVGFGSRNTFSRVFKQYTGLSPLEFQKQKENKQPGEEF